MQRQFSPSDYRLSMKCIYIVETHSVGRISEVGSVAVLVSSPAGNGVSVGTASYEVKARASVVSTTRAEVSVEASNQGEAAPVSVGATGDNVGGVSPVVALDSAAALEGVGRATDGTSLVYIDGSVTVVVSTLEEVGSADVTASTAVVVGLEGGVTDDDVDDSEDAAP